MSLRERDWEVWEVWVVVVGGVLAAKLLSNLCSSAPLLLNFYGSQM